MLHTYSDTLKRLSPFSQIGGNPQKAGSPPAADSHMTRPTSSFQKWEVAPIQDLTFSHFPLPDTSVHKEVVRTLVQEQKMEVDDDSLDTMASALCEAGIDTIEEARKFKLKVVSPGPIFHTWYAINKTTLFNGKNNPKGFDYVQTIKDESEYLRQFHLPVLLVYSTLNMTSQQVSEMQSLFTGCDNIVSICLEADFSGHRMTTSLAQIEGDLACGIASSDYIRYAALIHWSEILDKALTKARGTGKKAAEANLTWRKEQSLVYSDIDNIQIRPNLFMLSGPGFLNCSHPTRLEACDIRRCLERQHA